MLSSEPAPSSLRPWASAWARPLADDFTLTCPLWPDAQKGTFLRGRTRGHFYLALTERKNRCGGKVENRVSGFPLFHPLVGAVGMWETRSVFQGRWGRVGKRGWLFHAFHRPSFPQLSGCGRARLLPLQGRAPKPEAFGASFDDVRLIRNSIHQRLTEPRIWDDFRPFRERQVCCQ